MTTRGQTEYSWYEELGALPFDETLREMVARLELSLYRIAEFSDIDRPYLHRLATGEKSRPSRKTVLAIGVALVRLGGDPLDIDELLASAGHLPLFVIHGVRPMHRQEKEFAERTVGKRNRNTGKQGKNR
jgi:hypothetical protein